MESYSLIQIVSLLGHHATITLKSKPSDKVEGYLFTIDPVNFHIALFNNNRVIVVFNQDVADLKIDEENYLDLTLIDKALNYQEQDQFTEEWIHEQRKMVFELFDKHRIPYQYEEPVIHVLGSARVEYPYVATSVVCDNALIRKRVRDLLLNIGH